MQLKIPDVTSVVMYVHTFIIQDQVFKCLLILTRAYVKEQSRLS